MKMKVSELTKDWKQEDWEKFSKWLNKRDFNNFNKKLVVDIPEDRFLKEKDKIRAIHIEKEAYNKVVENDTNKNLIRRWRPLLINEDLTKETAQGLNELLVFLKKKLRILSPQVNNLELLKTILRGVLYLIEYCKTNKSVEYHTPINLADLLNSDFLLFLLFFKKTQNLSPEEKEKIEESYERLSQRKNLITDPQLVEDIPKIAPYRLDKKHLEEKVETKEEVILKYKILFGNEVIFYILIVPKEEYKERQNFTFGDKMRKMLFLITAFAVEEKTFSPTFRKYHILKLINKERINNEDYNRLDNIFQTFGYITYDIRNNKKGKEYRRSIGHIIDNIEWLGKGKNSYISVNLNRGYFNKSSPLIEGRKTGYQYISIPKDRLTGKFSKDKDNFLNYLDSLRGQRTVYPILIKTLFMEKLGYTREELKHMGHGEIMKKLNDCLKIARETGRLKDHKYDYMGSALPKNILHWKLNLYLNKKP